MINIKNKVAKNTLMLYVRTLVIMFVSLFTVRVILNALGVVDFGIQNVVAGFVSMFTFVTGSLSGTISRTMSLNLGKNDEGDISEIYSVSLLMMFVISFLLSVVVEVFGVYFIKNEMNIPVERLYSAIWAFHFSVLTLFVNIISIPFESLIISYERMGIYAYISIVDAILKLFIAYALSFSSVDKLVLYSFLLFIEALIIRVLYSFFCKKNNLLPKFTLISHSSYFKEIIYLTVWDFWGSSSYVLKNYGVNLILNVFFGAVINASRGLAMQVNSAVTKFSFGFLTALRPHIIKTYASGDNKYLMSLVNNGTRFACYLLILLSIPIITECKYVLCLWLGDVPDYTEIFVVLILILSLSEGALVYAHNTLLMATGHVRKCQIITGLLQLLNIPFSYLLLYWGFSPYVTIVLAIIIANICCFIRVFILQRLVGYSVLEFIKSVYIKIIIVYTVSSLLPLFFRQFIEEGFIRLLISVIVSFAWTSFVVLFIGCSKDERCMLKNKLKMIL